MPPVRCFPQIVQFSVCPPDELDFATAPATCVRVMHEQGELGATLAVSPPEYHFIIAGDGTVFQLAPITPTHALLAGDTCIRVGILVGVGANQRMTQAQADVLPGVLRYILTQTGLPLANVINDLPVYVCRRTLWDDIVQETTDCLSQSPPPPFSPPVVSCAFVRSCFSAGQNIAISTGGVISAGQLVFDTTNNTATWFDQNGNPVITFAITIVP